MKNIKKIEIPERAFLLLREKGFMDRFLENCSQDITYREAYEATEDELGLYFKVRRYKNYNSFRSAKYRYFSNKKTKIMKLSTVGKIVTIHTPFYPFGHKGFKVLTFTIDEQTDHTTMAFTLHNQDIETIYQFSEGDTIRVDFEIIQKYRKGKWWTHLAAQNLEMIDDAGSQKKTKTEESIKRWKENGSYRTIHVNIGQ